MARSSRTVPIRRARALSGKREDGEEISLVEIDVQFAVQRGTGGIDIGDIKQLPIGAARKPAPTVSRTIERAPSQPAM